MSEESTQIFRGSEAPEITFTESRTAAKPKPAAAPPADRRDLDEAKDGPADTGPLPGDAAGADGADASQRRIDDVIDEREPELRQLHDSTAPLPPSAEPAPAPDHAQLAAEAAAAAQGPAETRAWQDTSATAPPGASNQDSAAMLPPAEAIVDSRVMLPVADAAGEAPGGPVEARQLNDTSAPLPATGALPPQDGVIVPPAGSDGRSGPSDPRRLRDTVVARPGASFQPDAEPLPPAAAPQDVDSGPAEARQLQDIRADKPAPAAKAEAAAAGGISDPDLTFKPHDATPWALSIHLQERIASLGVSTARVGHQLDALEESIKRLGKRIKK